MTNPELADKILSLMMKEKRYLTPAAIAEALGQNKEVTKECVFDMNLAKDNWFHVDTKAFGDNPFQVRLKPGFLDVAIAYTIGGGFVDEFYKVNERLQQAAEDEQRARVERETGIEANLTTIAVNKDTLKYAKLTRYISIGSAVISLAALALSLFQGCA